MGKKRSLDFHLLSMCKSKLEFFPSAPLILHQYKDSSLWTYATRLFAGVRDFGFIASHCTIINLFL